VFLESLQRSDHLGDLGTDGKTMLKWIFSKLAENCELDLSGSEERLLVGSCKYHNKSAGFIKHGKLNDYVHNYQLLNEASAPWSQSDTVHMIFYYSD
jgi:hypothetical protein